MNFSPNEEFDGGYVTPKTEKKISVKVFALVLAVAILVSALAAVMATSMYLHRAYQEQLNSYISVLANDSYYTLDEVRRLFATYYIGDISQLTEEEITDALIRMYIAQTGDMYAQYWNEEELEEYDKSMQGQETGIGVIVNYNIEESAIGILYVHEKSPAEKAGCLVGDIIVAVEGERISDIGYEAAVNKIKGDVGTDVNFTVLRNGEEIVLTATREEFTSVSVVSKMLSDNKTAYIRILQFDGTTVEQFAKAYLALEASGAESFVFDVRGNPGGALVSVMGVLSFLLGNDVPLIEISDNSGGIIIQNSNRAAYCTDAYSKSKTTVHDKKTVVLANENTASAGELFTAVMSLHYTIVGVKTFGKGVMQRTYPLPNGGAVKLTFAKYTAPGVENYDGVGIIPHITQELSDDVKGQNLFTLAEEKDDQLQAALKALYGSESAQ